MNIRLAMCATCGFETFVSDYDTMERIHVAYDGAHEPNWWVDDEPYRHRDVHILSATEVFLDNGFRGHVTHCHAVFRYGRSVEFVIGNYAGSNGATCKACVDDYTERYA